MVDSASSFLADDYYNFTAGDSASDEAEADDPYPLRDNQNQLSQHSHGISFEEAHVPTHAKKQASLANIAIPSFTAFRSQASSIPISSPGRSSQQAGASLASSRLTSDPATDGQSSRLGKPGARPFSLDSPLPQQPSGREEALSPPSTVGSGNTVGDRDLTTQTSLAHSRTTSVDSRSGGSGLDFSPRLARRSSTPVHTKYAAEQTIYHAPERSISSVANTSQFPPLKPSSLRPLMISHSQAPSMTLQFDGEPHSLSNESASTATSERRPKSPVSKGLGAFFGWRSSTQKSGTESPTTTISDRSLSPVHSPHLQKPSDMESHGGSVRLTPPGLDIHKANSLSPTYFEREGTPVMPISPRHGAHMNELEQELVHISAELAGSIRREMELEDELERMKLEYTTLHVSESGRRSSDYFSDSGASVMRFPISDPDAKIEELEKLRRKAEQDKGQIQAEHAQRLQTEIMRSRGLEKHVLDLEGKLHDQSYDEAERMHLIERMGELESVLDETKRRLSQERQANNNFEGLYSATREELEQRQNERDNLRDEILPQLKSRVEGLEAETADMQSLIYENTRLQQELVASREEPRVFPDTPRLGQGQHAVFGRIAEENDDEIVSPGGPRSAGLTRSGSLARSGSKRGGSVTRSGSVKDREGGRQRSGSVGGGHALGLEGQKEVEDQRDALHKALKLLITRHEKQRQDHERAIKKLMRDKTAVERVASNASPKRSQYQREVSFLKHEVATLRKRTEDALEQKWQYEKGLSGIKMDLDRAEQETRGLRTILQEHDILASSPESSNNEIGQTTEPGVITASAEVERDHARRVAEAYRQRALDLQEASSADSDSQPPAVAQLFDSANRMDELAEHLETQVQTNASLRARLAEAVEKGEQEQRQSTRQIAEMQTRLAGLESSVLAAQQHSETSLSTHETDVRRLEEASSPHLQRLTIDIPAPGKLVALSPLLKKPPLLGSKKLSDISLLEMSRTQMLERKVREMESLLREAEEDMQHVVQRVNRSQFEVAELTGERDAAFIQMRKLQDMIVEERDRAEGLM